MNDEFKEIMGDKAFKELAAIVKRNADIRNITDYETTKKAIQLLMTWIDACYSLTTDQRQSIEEPDIDIEKLYIIKN